jgi:alkylation response protein AidB-like acyl-CoA dehydrogenase
MISFALTQEQEIARAAAAAFADARASPHARAADETGAFRDDLIEAVWRLGLVQAVAESDAPEQPTVLNALVLEELAYGDAALALALAAPLGFAKAIAEQGDERQKRTYLRAVANDSPGFAAIAHTDAGWFGGERQRTRAVKVAGGWLIDGAKALVPHAARCVDFLVTAETATGACAFLVPARTNGVVIGAAKGTLGLRALQMADVGFDNVFAPDDSRLGASDGTTVRRIVDLSRVALCAILSGLARRVYDTALPYAKQRVVHGEAIARKQAVAFKLADMRIATQAMRWMGLRAASELDAAPTATRNARLAHRYAAENGLKIADEGVQLFGGYGFVRDLPLEMWYRNARSLSVLDGLVGA